ncbi:MAG TPA: hypothetical protein VEX86_15960, partial [Longimicrobium sp.]|nr:hypothetical protein [Longimicrobium sp.]
MDAAPPPRPAADPPLTASGPLPNGPTLPVPRAAAVFVDAEPVAETDFAAARVPCPVCGTRLEATREHCFGCGWKVVAPDAAGTATALRASARAIYLLMGLSLFLALPAVGALVLAYVDRGKARGTWLDGHFEWQVDTLWGVFWMGVAVLAATWLGGRFLGTGAWGLLTGLPALAWYVHRIVKGWTRLSDGDPITG